MCKEAWQYSHKAVNMDVDDTGFKKISFAKRMYSTHLLDLKDSFVKKQKNKHWKWI